MRPPRPSVATTALSLGEEAAEHVPDRNKFEKKSASLMTRQLCHALPHAVRLQLEEVLVHVAWLGLGLTLTLGGPPGLLSLTLILLLTPRP